MEKSLKNVVTINYIILGIYIVLVLSGLLSSYVLKVNFPQPELFDHLNEKHWSFKLILLSIFIAAYMSPLALTVTVVNVVKTVRLHKVANKKSIVLAYVTSAVILVASGFLTYKLLS